MVVDNMEGHIISQTDCFARQLANYDDLASAITLDVMLGFSTHKMNFVPLPKRPRFEDVFNVLANYRKHNDEQEALDCFLSLLGEYWTKLRTRRVEHELAFAKEHVRKYAILQSICFARTKRIVFYPIVDGCCYSLCS